MWFGQFGGFLGWVRFSGGDRFREPVVSRVQLSWLGVVVSGGGFAFVVVRGGGFGSSGCRFDRGLVGWVQLWWEVLVVSGWMGVQWLSVVVGVLVASRWFGWSLMVQRWGNFWQILIIIW